MGQAQSLAYERNLALEARIKAHVQNTASPESCPGLAWSKPPKGQDYVIIWKFGLDPVKRPDRAMAPCPICSGLAPKYYHGAIAWFPHEQVYRAIGQECAGHSIGRAQADKAESEYRERRSHDADYEFAYENIVVIPAVIQHFEALEPIVVHAEGLVRLLGRSQVRRLVYNAVRARDGALIVWEKGQGDGALLAEPIPINLGRVRGYECLGPNFHVARNIRQQVPRLHAMDHGDSDAARAWILDHYRARYDLALFRKSIIAAKDVQRRAVAYLGMVQEFMSVQNFEAIGKYGEDPRNPHTFYAAHRNGEFRAGLSRLDAVTIRPNLSAIDLLPSWPEFSDMRPK